MDSFKPSLLSLFCGPGGLDLGFEQAGFNVLLAADISRDSINTYNHNRPKKDCGVVVDLSIATIDYLDNEAGFELQPNGVIGGPPCQGFSRANRSPLIDDPRNKLLFNYLDILKNLNNRKPLDFFVFENVVEISASSHKEVFEDFVSGLKDAGFRIFSQRLNAHDFGVPQSRERLIIVGFNRKKFTDVNWVSPCHKVEPIDRITVHDAIGRIPEPVYFQKNMKRENIPFHPNHWCMQPKSKRFSTPGALRMGDARRRSFKVLSWEKPSLTVAYGNREVHIHPSCHRRLSVFEAMQLQGFPIEYELLGSLSSQITQVSEAVPPPVAHAIAQSVSASIYKNSIINVLT